MDVNPTHGTPRSSGEGASTFRSGSENAGAAFGEAPAPSDPKGAPRRKRSTRLWFVGAALGSALLSWALSGTSPLQLLELKTYDLRWVLRGRQPPPPHIVLVVLDERTETAFPEPRIFWHPHVASLLRAAAAGGARAIGLDVSFALSVEPWAPDLDRQLASAFAEVSANVPVILTYDNLQAFPDGLPLYILASSQGNLGFANLTVDRDNFVRRQQLRSQDAAAWESFAARLAAVALKAPWEQNRSPDPALRLGDRAIPLDRSGFLLIHYWGPEGTFPAVSLAEVLAAAEKGNTAQIERWFQGNIVLLGARDASDRKPTPFYLAGGEQRLTTGVEIQANILATLLEGRFLKELSPLAASALVLLFAFLAAWLTFRLRFPVAPALLAAVLAIYFAVSVLSLRAGFVLPVVSPALAVVLGGFSSYGVYAKTEGRKRRLLEDMFGRYVSPELAQEILEHEQIPLGGTRQPVTVMFCDLRDYTRYCQGRDPQQVVAELNEYFREMTAEIKAHGGMVNKFIGDGIMALFGAPVPHPEDPYRAVACALRMIARNQDYNRRRATQGLEPLLLGVGIHTGDAVVGTVGAPEKMEYTAIGDTVNVASRIEGENKTFHTQMLLSEATYQWVRDRVVAELAGSANLKGVTEAVALYSVKKLLKNDSEFRTVCL